MEVPEILKSITSDELNRVIDADLSAHDSQTSDAEHIVVWLGREYPEFMQFAHDCVGRYFEGGLDDDNELAQLITMNTAITLGALCRAVEARRLPTI